MLTGVTLLFLTSFIMNACDFSCVWVTKNHSVFGAGGGTLIVTMRPDWGTYPEPGDVGLITNTHVQPFYWWYWSVWRDAGSVAHGSWWSLSGLGVRAPLWALILISGVPAACLWYRTTRRQAPSACRSCGYDQHGLPKGVPCPECGGK